ncbi:hypothetical protein J6524_18690 [Bradyrhizobium sp. WSM 1738]|uniref:hypothetical protein n=1 Tax=Bradyrhizobium hereditatis TaxID=2821405 RepID=UPI001CE25C8F|nr:hypothetical protein [Bradyrhizobium hereditatis]MCA6116895.1 hypothetical protein [Bradyrhizobium hereditatis]
MSHTNVPLSCITTSTLDPTLADAILGQRIFILEKKRPLIFSIVNPAVLDGLDGVRELMNLRWAFSSGRGRAVCSQLHAAIFMIFVGSAHNDLEHIIRQRTL